MGFGFIVLMRARKKIGKKLQQWKSNLIHSRVKPFSTHSTWVSYNANVTLIRRFGWYVCQRRKYLYVCKRARSHRSYSFVMFQGMQTNKGEGMNDFYCIRIQGRS